MITGTFLDEISHDIPSANWGPEEWDRDFATMKEPGIDTVIIIRAGYQDRATFESRVLNAMHGYLIVQQDLVDLFLTLAEKYGMRLFFGTYDSGEYWVSGRYQQEIDINKAFADEVWERYGDRAAFRGWYICHEINSFDEGVMRVYEQLAAHLRGLKQLPILISPYVRGAKQFDDPISLHQHAIEWEEICSRISESVDIVAFQDGQIHYRELRDYMAVNADLAKKYGLKLWSNVESFSRDTHIKFPPIAFPKLRFKIDQALAAGVDKLITFEFSHFMSPNSMYPSAHNLYKMYKAQYLDARPV